MFWLRNRIYATQQKETEKGNIGTVVPLHREIKIGTLKGILELAKIEEDIFAQKQ